MSATPYDDFAAAVLAIDADVRATQVAVLRIAGLLDQITAGCEDAAETIDALSAPAADRALTPAERRQRSDRAHALLKKHRTMIEHGCRLRDEARARIARCALRLDAAQSTVDQLRTGDDRSL